MVEYSGCDVHKNTSVFMEIDEDGELQGPCRIRHGTGELREHLESLPEGTPVAFETGGSWYWLADLIEEAGCEPRLVHARKAEARMGNTNKTDSLDAKELAILQKTGTLPDAWIPPKEIRDRREALRLRMKLSQSLVRWKNRIRGVLNQHGIRIEVVADLFCQQGQERLRERLSELPEHTQESVAQQLKTVRFFEERRDRWDQRLERVLENSKPRECLRTIPGVGAVLSAVILLEVADVSRFPGPGHLASYAGTTPRIHQSGEHRRDGGLRKDANSTLKWAFFEAANVVVRHQKTFCDSRLIRKYRRLKKRKNTQVAKGAVARMLAESTYWVLTKEEPYKEPNES